MSITGGPHDGVLAAALILVGGLAALAGLWMLLRRRENRWISAAVFAAGAMLLVLPWVQGRVAEPPPAAPPEPVSVGKGIVISPDGLRTIAVPNPAARPPPLPGRTAATIDIEATEAEPNDNLAAANLGKLGTAIDGTLAPGEQDYFAIDIPDGTRGQIVVNLMVRNASASLTLFDDAGQSLGTTTTFEELAIRNTMLERKLDRPRYYVLVQGLDGPETAYQLTVAARRLY